MSCVNSSCCCCHGCAQPVSSSQPAVDAASCTTVGTNDTINALIAQGGKTINAIFQQKAAQQQLAVKAQTQIATSQVNAFALVAIAVIVIVGFLSFSRFWKK